MRRPAAPSILLAVLAAGASLPAVAAGPESACVTCHAELFDEMLAPVTVWDADAHAAAGLGCESCHGGDASPGLGAEPEASMSEAHGFRPPPTRLEVAEFCAACHSDAQYMKAFDPQARIDQLAEYVTSAHGRANAAGDPVPATCTDCHGAHGIRPVTSPEAPVYATNVPELCGGCHSDPEIMEPYGLPTTPYDEYRASAHALVLYEVGDTAAPACNDCHGNHGAAPPGVSAVANVCGQCHGRESKLFRASFKKELFDALEVGECTACHGHHEIRHPTPELFHGGSEPAVSAGRVVDGDPFRAELGDLGAGATVEASWLVVLRPHIAADDERFVHHVEIAVGGTKRLQVDATVRQGREGAGAATRAAEGSGLSATLDLEPTAGWPVRSGDAVRMRLRITATSALEEVVVRDLPGEALEPVAGSACLTCHSPGDECDQASERMYEALIGLERHLRDAEAVLHRAEVQGMEVREPLFELKSKGRTAAVESRALIHAFAPERLLERTAEGEEVARAAEASGEAALEELAFRHRGLGVSLILVALVLAGLAFKIRQIDRAPRRVPGD